MDKLDIYHDIACRTDGDIYIGVVGPVRTGKSTFIKNFMDMVILPNITDLNSRERTKDELPQSSSGKTIMTTEPKFIPSEAVTVNLNNNISFNTIMIDCVGYMVPSAQGHIENETERAVKTPWFDEDIPFTQAAEIGTKKVITEHSTVGIVVTTDGTVTDISREDYLEAEERVINELKGINKPFVVLLNTDKPYADETIALKNSLKDKYNVPVLPINCKQLKMDDVNIIFDSLLYEFPLKKINYIIPKWISFLDNDHWLKSGIINQIKNNIENVTRLRDVKDYVDGFEQNFTNAVAIDKIDLSNGITDVSLSLKDNIFFDILSETTGVDIDNEFKLISIIKELSDNKKEYDKISVALNEAKVSGYGVVSPLFEEMTLKEPEIVKQGSKYGVKLRATAPSIHLIKVDMEAEISPVIGTEKQSEDFVNYFMNDFENETDKLWESNIFGKSLNDLVNEELQNKLHNMPKEAQYKMQEALQKIINEGTGGLICIII